jgi:serine/threonine protein kinase
VDILLQILNGFKTLVKNKIMHRDFKLANILKHDGCIKIADFGFSKLLGNESLANTMLGSPLNMAPEVLSNVEYNSRADIWSVGICFYELLFGRPPFLANNMVDLLKNIHKSALKIDRSINRISEEAEDVLRKMLIVDPNKRISWEELFVHNINSYRQERLKKELEHSLKCGDLLMNMSKFYIKNNMV